MPWSGGNVLSSVHSRAAGFWLTTRLSARVQLAGWPSCVPANCIWSVAWYEVSVFRPTVASGRSKAPGPREAVASVAGPVAVGGPPVAGVLGVGGAALPGVDGAAVMA